MLALALLFLLYRDLDLARFLDAIGYAHRGWILLLIASLLLEFLVQGWKWRQLLYELKPVASLRLAGAIIAGYGANVLVPLGVGPFVRAWLVARQENLRMASVLITTAIGRFIDGIVFALIAIAVAAFGQVTALGRDLQIALGMAGMLNLVIFALVLWLMFRARSPLARDDNLLSRLVDWVASLNPQRFGQLRSALAGGLLWPAQRSRQLAVVAGSIAAKGVAATHFAWAGLAVGVVLAPFEYLLVMVVAGFALILTRLVRVPGGFVVGAGFALKLLGVPDEQALAMILFSQLLATVLVVVIGLPILWQSGIDIRAASRRMDRNTDPPE